MAATLRSLAGVSSLSKAAVRIAVNVAWSISGSTFLVASMTAVTAADPPVNPAPKAVPVRAALPTAEPARATSQEMGAARKTGSARPVRLAASSPRSMLEFITE